MELGIFKDICISANYLGLVDKVAYAFANGGSWDDYDGIEDCDMDQDAGQSTAISFLEEPGFDEYGVYGFVLTPEAVDSTAAVDAVVYLLSEDEEDFICIGYTSDVLADWESGIFEDNFDGYWFSLPDGQCLSVDLVEECDGYDVFTSPVEINGEEKNLRFAWNYITGRIRVLGIWDGIDENGIASRPGDSLKAGDRILPLYDAFSADSYEESVYIGEDYVWQDDDELVFSMLPDGSYLYAFNIIDIFGGEYTTDFVQFDVDEGDILYSAA